MSKGSEFASGRRGRFEEVELVDVEIGDLWDTADSLDGWDDDVDVDDAPDDDTDGFFSDDVEELDDESSA